MINNIEERIMITDRIVISVHDNERHQQAAITTMLPGGVDCRMSRATNDTKDVCFLALHPDGLNELISRLEELKEYAITRMESGG